MCQAEALSHHLGNGVRIVSSINFEREETSVYCTAMESLGDRYIGCYDIFDRSLGIARLLEAIEEIGRASCRERV